MAKTKTRKPRPASVRTAVDAFIAARDRFRDTDYERGNSTLNSDQDAWQSARVRAYDAVVAAMGHPDEWPAALDLGDLIVIIDYNPENEVDPVGSEPDEMCVLCVLPKARIASL